MIQCSRIYYRLGSIIATEHYEQIADHGSLLVVIKLYHIFIAQLLQCHLHHRHGTLYYLLSSRNDG